MKKKVDSCEIKIFDTQEKYDYQKVLISSHCPTCNNLLKWQILIQKDDDRFCHALCCGVRYSMIPEVVRIISTIEVDSYKEELTNEKFIDSLINHTMKELKKQRINHTMKELKKQSESEP
jgi:hypothetical protein